jgi:hypothetical protein
MKGFESSGLWFPAEEPSNAVGGTLKFGDDGLDLMLLGSFREGWSPGSERFPIILGMVVENTFGSFVSLFDCRKKQATLNMVGVTSETIKCRKAVIGNCHLPDGASHFETLAVQFSFLKDWVGLTGITREMFGDPFFSVKYAKAEKLPFKFGDKTLTVAFTANMSGGKHHAVIDEDIHILVEPIGERSPEELGGDRIQTLQNLLTFATDKPNETEEIVYLGIEDNEGSYNKHHLIYDPVFRLNGEKKSLHSSDLLFTFLDAQAAGLNIFQNWLDFTERHPSFCTVYFANLYAEPRYVDEKFARLMSAFTLLTTNLGKVSQRTKLFLKDIEDSLKVRFSEEERELLGHVIPTGSEMEMPSHLLCLLQDNADVMGRVIEDIPGFVRSVSDTLYFFQRRVEGSHPPLGGGALYYAMLKLRMLVKIVILKELGFSEEAVKALVEKNQHFNFLKTV